MASNIDQNGAKTMSFYVFKKYANFDFSHSLTNCLLIIGDSCEENFNDKVFVKLTIAGCHNKIYCYFYKERSLSAEQMVL